MYHCQCDITNRDVAIKILKSEAKKRRLPREKRKEQLLGEQEEKERSFLSSSQNSYVVDYYGSFVGPSPESVKSQTQDSNKKQESTLLQQDLPLKQFDVDVNQDLMGTLAIGDTATATATAAVGDSADDYLIGHLDTMAGDDEEETVIENTHRERTRLDILSGFRAMGMGRKVRGPRRPQRHSRRVSFSSLYLACVAPCLDEHALSVMMIIVATFACEAARCHPSLPGFVWSS